MKAIILAAGQGTRLKKYTENLPKGMLSFGGKTLIERQIEIYRSCVIDKIIIVKGYAADKIQYPDVTYYVNRDYENTNMVESLLCAKLEFNDEIIVSYSDILFEKSMLRKMMDSQMDFAVSVDDNWHKYWNMRYGRIDFDTESLVIDEKDCITELGLENPSEDKMDARYIGLLKFSPKGLDEIIQIMDAAYKKFENRPWQQSGKTAKKAYMTDLLNAVILSGEAVNAIHFDNGWIEFDTNEDYEKACEWKKNGILKELIHL